jgi:hypothetical protein
MTNLNIRKFIRERLSSFLSKFVIIGPTTEDATPLNVKMSLERTKNFKTYTTSESNKHREHTGPFCPTGFDSFTSCVTITIVLYDLVGNDGRDNHHCNS